MEEEKAAAYYDELSRKGEGAAKFKQGLGFSSSSINDDAAFSKPNNSNSNKLLFVKAASSSSNPNSNPQFEKESQLKSIQQKLSKNKSNRSTSSVTDTDRDRDIYRGRERRRSRSPSPRREHRRSTHRRRSSSRERDRYRESDRDRDRDRERRVKRSLSPPPRDKRSKKGKKDGIDYAKLIHGYDKMSPAERVKEKMKLQLSETAKKDAVNAQGPGWERFDFDKDAPLDDEEIEAADDDKELVKHIGQSFRFSTVETKNEEKLKAAHDEAMFGAPSVFPQAVEAETELDEDESNEEKAVSLMSDQVLAMQQGSWRDRARKV